MQKTNGFRIGLLCLALTAGGCSQAPEEEVTEGQSAAKPMAVEFEKIELDNGLDVIFHQDHSDPVVAVALTVHVGSAREKPNRTGFAHLFEHLLFLESENLGKGGLDKLSARIGGSGANGSTSRDRTNYFQTVPKDALEKMIWAEADKLGWFINTVTQPVLDKEKQVVKNEKRQGVDNRPYGHTSYVIDKHLYPADHPYHWQVIGSLQDLQAATLTDVKDFFRDWYVPNNTTLVIAGDFELEQAKAWVHKYFDEIPRGKDIVRMEKRPATLAKTVSLYHEDNFARLPQLTHTWPTVPRYHEDSYPLTVLASYLSEGKQAPLYQQLVEDDQLTSNVFMFSRHSELAGQLRLTVRANPGQDLDNVAQSVNQAFARFEQSGIPAEELARIKARQETEFYQSLSSVLGKGFQLAQYSIFANDPGFVSEDIQRILDVSQQDVMRVYNTYIKNKPMIATSFVPKGRPELALENASKAEVVEEQIVANAENEVDASAEAEYLRTPSTFDRSVEPAFGDKAVVQAPPVWRDTLDNGLTVMGIESSEVPLVQLELRINGGMLLDPADKIGVANLVAQMLTQGTTKRTAAEFEQAVQLLGADIEVFADTEYTLVSITTLKRNLADTLALVEEMLVSPAWSEKEFALLKQRNLTILAQQQASPNAIAANTFNTLLYPDDQRGANPLGTEQSLNSIGIADLQAYHSAFYTPSVATLHVTGDVNQAELMTLLNSGEQSLAAWTGSTVTLPQLAMPAPPESSKLYFYDVPNAKQSVLQIGYPALTAMDADYYPATMMNYRLGGGGFASQLTQQLREGKGYTYGIRSGFSGGMQMGEFSIGSGVRSNVTYQSVSLIKDILENYAVNYNQADLETTQSFLLRSGARAFETANAKLTMLTNISQYQLPDDYVNERQRQVENLNIDQVRKLAVQYADSNKMIWLVVGDAATQLKPLTDLGFGEPILLNPKTTDTN